MKTFGMTMLAPAVEKGTGGFDFSTVEIIVIIVAVLGALAIVGWRSPDRPPHADEKTKIEKLDD
jgi:hypothetical protein